MAFIPKKQVLLLCTGMQKSSPYIRTACKQLHPFLEPRQIFQGLGLPKVCHTALGNFLDILSAFF